MGLNESVKLEMNKYGHFGHLNGQNWAEVIPHLWPICRFYSKNYMAHIWPKAMGITYSV